MTTTLARNAMWVVALSVLGGGLGYLYADRSTVVTDQSGASAFGPPEREELVLIVIMSSRCGACNSPTLPETVKAIRSAVAREAKVPLFVHGIAVDAQLHTGFSFISNRFGPLDELSVGRGWANDAMLRYVWSEFPGEPAVPQLVLVRRSATVRPAPVIGVSNQVVLDRRVGLNEIGAWAVELSEEGRGAADSRLR